jgi:hypothetical protein
MNHACVAQNALCGCGFAGINVGGNAKIASEFKIGHCGRFIECAGFLPKKFRGAKVTVMFRIMMMPCKEIVNVLGYAGSKTTGIPYRPGANILL